MSFPATEVVRCACALRGVCAQKAQEFDPLAQPASRHLPAAQHLFDDFPDLSRPEIETPVELLHAVKDLLPGEVWVAERGELDTLVIYQARTLGLTQPATGERLAVQRRARIGGGERDLDRVRIDLLGELDGPLDGLRGLPRQAEDKGAVNHDAESAAVRAEPSCDVGAQPLPDVMQDSVIPG